MLVVFLYYIDELYVFTLHIEHILNLFFVERQLSGTPTTALLRDERARLSLLLVLS